MVECVQELVYRFQTLFTETVSSSEIRNHVKYKRYQKNVKKVRAVTAVYLPADKVQPFEQPFTVDVYTLSFYEFFLVLRFHILPGCRRGFEGRAKGEG